MFKVELPLNSPPLLMCAEAALLFGRGMRAGIDRREQKKNLVTLERDSLRRGRAAAGIEETTETRRQEREREKIANQYDGFDMRVGGGGGRGKDL